MPLRIKCPAGHSLIVSESRAGKLLRCPKCQAEVQVPGEEKVTQPAAPLQPLLAITSPTEPAVKVGKSDRVPKRKLTAKEHRWRKDVPPAKAPARPESIVAQEAAAVAMETIEPPPVLLPPPLPAPAPPAPPPIIVPPVMPQLEVIPAPREPLEPITTAVGAEVREVHVTEPVTEPTPPPVASNVAPSSPAYFALPPAVPVERPPVVHGKAKRMLAYQLAAAVIAAAVFSVLPSGWDVVEYLQHRDEAFVARWALVLGVMGLVQMAYAAYLIQLPDWTTVWVVTLFSLASSALYAMALGLTLISGEDGWLVQFLQLSDKVAGGKAAMWCLCMVSVTTLLAFFAGRISTGWRQAEAVLREAAQ